MRVRSGRSHADPSRNSQPRRPLVRRAAAAVSHRDDKIDGVVITFVDISERHVAEAAVLAGEDRQRLLLSELTHRVRNSLAVIQAIARHTLQGNQPREEELKRFEGRLAALAGAYTLLVESDWKGADLAESPTSSSMPMAEKIRTVYASRERGFAAGGSGDAIRSRAARTGDQCRQTRRFVESDRQIGGDLDSGPRQQGPAHQG